MDPEKITLPQEIKLVVASVDIAGFGKLCEIKTDYEIFEILSDYYELAGDLIEKAGGHIIKFIGDAILIVYPADIAKKAVTNLRLVKESIDSYFKTNEIRCTLYVKAHIGQVTVGKIGTRTKKQLDIFGKTVNSLMRMPSQEFILSSDLQSV